MRRSAICTDHTLEIAHRMYYKYQTSNVREISDNKMFKQVIERPFFQMYKLAILHNRFDILGQFPC